MIASRCFCFLCCIWLFQFCGILNRKRFHQSKNMEQHSFQKFCFIKKQFLSCTKWQFILCLMVIYAFLAVAVAWAVFFWTGTIRSRHSIANRACSVKVFWENYRNILVAIASEDLKWDALFRHCKDSFFTY
jgi:hypothetical protein